MAYELPLPSWAKEKGWKVKIRDKERLEPPHATILKRTQSWRWGLRTRTFMDRWPNPREVPEALLESMEAQHAALCRQWDQMYPENPVNAEQNDA